VYLDIKHDARRLTVTPDYSVLDWREQPYDEADTAQAT
jgi:hypothetical protein